VQPRPRSFHTLLGTPGPGNASLALSLLFNRRRIAIEADNVTRGISKNRYLTGSGYSVNEYCFGGKIRV